MTGLYLGALAAIAPWPAGGSPPNPPQWPVEAEAAIRSLRPGPYCGAQGRAIGRPPQRRAGMFFQLPPQKEVVT